MARERPVTLICAVSGTGLSKVADTFRGGSSVVLDLEDRLCEDLTSHPGLSTPLGVVPSMAQVVNLPRTVLTSAWDDACETILNEQVAALGTARLQVICLHLTWYNSSTSEFFSPTNVPLLAQYGIVGQVVLLIDDIYDMFSRLRGPNELYNDGVIKARAELLAKFWRRPTDPGTSAPPEERSKYERDRKIFDSRRRLEVMELALGQLIAWRRAEMIQAESLARTLDAEFTLLGTKHSKPILGDLARGSGLPKIYISHRISEVRRMNKSTNSLPGDLGSWSPVADEVNHLHRRFAAAGLLLINPTAIDELRFDNAPDGDGHSPLLARRWPLPERTDLLWSHPGGHSPEHTELLSGDLPVSDPISSGVAGSLSNQIFFDIAARDHIIVEHTPGLCAYRPFFRSSHDAEGSRADWSGGVKREIRRWDRKTRALSRDNASDRAEGAARPIGETASTPVGPDHPKAAFVHTGREIEARLRWLEAEGRLGTRLYETAKDLLKAALKEVDFPDEHVRDLLSGKINAQAGQLGSDPYAHHYVAQRPATVLRLIGAATTAALHHIFTRLPLPKRT